MGSERGNGFVLISAIWMLTLAGGIAAALTLRSVDTSRAVKADVGKLKEELALRGAIDLMVGDAILNGPRSAWWRVPSSGRIVIGGVEINLQTSPEAGRLDLNAADPTAIDDGLAAKGWDRSERMALIAKLQARRQAAGAIKSFDEIAGIYSGTRCVLADATLYSGLSRPIEQTDSSFAGETAIRVEATAAGGRTLALILRPGGASRPYDVMEWRPAPFCPSNA